jgi:hypothetical protein
MTVVYGLYYKEDNYGDFPLYFCNLIPRFYEDELSGEHEAAAYARNIELNPLFI